jgi:hypothetical protein
MNFENFINNFIKFFGQRLMLAKNHNKKAVKKISSLWNYIIVSAVQITLTIR